MQKQAFPLYYVFALLLLAIEATGSTSNTWAVLISTSRSWFNYRHTANTLAIYSSAKRLGLSDDRIILMLADDMACNPRNPNPGLVFSSLNHAPNMQGDGIQVDYRGSEVNAENVLRLLVGRHDASVPRSKRLLSDSGSNVLLYMTGHGGNEFIKLQDKEEIQSQELADAIHQMKEQGRFGNLLFMVDTCQAATLFSQVRSPSAMAVSSSIKKENSYSHVNDPTVGVSLVDRFTFFTLQFLNRIERQSNDSIKMLFDSLNPLDLMSTPHFDFTLGSLPLEETPITKFFSSVDQTVHVESSYDGFRGRA